MTWKNMGLLLLIVVTCLVCLGLGLRVLEDKHHEERFGVDAEKPALKKATVRCWAGGSYRPVVNMEFYAGTWEVHSDGWASFTDPRTNEKVFLTHGLCVKREKVGN